MSSGISFPPPERGRAATEASRVGVQQIREYNRTRTKTAFARRLRRASSDVEKRVWSRLRDGRLDGLNFRRQHPAGPYVLDFYCPRRAFRRQKNRDEKRTAWLRKCGVTELRFWNNDITRNLSGVLQSILIAADDLRAGGSTLTRRWRADLPLSGGG
jgi:very-short-patch-repair endonuclease